MTALPKAQTKYWGTPSVRFEAPSSVGTSGQFLKTLADGTTDWATVDLSGYVPYTGATTDLNLGSNGLTAGAITASGQFTNAVGTITSSTPATFSQTWNNAATTFNAFDLAATNTAFNSASKLFHFRCTNVIGGGNTPGVYFTPQTGKLTIDGPWNQASLCLGAVSQTLNGIYSIGLQITNSQTSALMYTLGTSYNDYGLQVETSDAPIGWSGVKLRKVANDILELRRSTNAQTFRVANTYTNSSNGEWGEIDWKTNSNVCRIGTNKNGTGSARNVEFIVGGTTTAKIDADATAGNIRFMVYDVDTGALQRVSVGAADSGGTGYKVLRIPN